MGCGLTCHQSVHLVSVLYFFDTMLFETLFCSDLGLFLFCLGVFPFAQTPL